MTRPDVEGIERAMTIRTALRKEKVDELTAYIHEVEADLHKTRIAAGEQAGRVASAEAERDAALRDLQTARGHIKALLNPRANYFGPYDDPGVMAERQRAARVFLTERSEERDRNVCGVRGLAADDTCPACGETHHEVAATPASSDTPDDDGLLHGKVVVKQGKFLRAHSLRSDTLPRPPCSTPGCILGAHYAGDHRYADTPKPCERCGGSGRTSLSSTEATLSVATADGKGVCNDCHGSGKATTEGA